MDAADSFKTFEDSTKIPLQNSSGTMDFDKLHGNFGSVSYSKMVYEFYFSGCYFTARTGVSGLARCVCICKTSFSGKKISVYADAFDHDDSGQIFIIPRYNTLAAVGLTNTRVALWIVRLFSVFAVFMMRQFILSVPRELDEAAMIDAADIFGFMLRLYSRY